MPKLVFVNRYFHPDHSATSQMLTDLALDLGSSGLRVQVITSRLLYDEPDAQLPAEEILESVEVRRVWTSRFGRHVLVGRAIDYVTFYVAALWALPRVLDRGDVLVVKTDPPLMSVPAALVAKLTGARLVNWVQDLFPEVAVALNVRGVGAMVRFLRRLRNWSMRVARLNVVLGERMKERLVAQSVPAERVAIIPNWADGETVRPVEPETNPLRHEWGTEDKFVVGYSGNMGRAHEFETILGVMDQLRDDKDIVFIFLGGGAGRIWLEDQCVSRDLRQVIFKPYQPKDKLAFSLGAIDLHLISLRPALEGLIVPSKFYGIAAAGRPTLYIGDDDGEIPGILAGARCGFSVPVGDVAGATAIIRRLQRDDRLRADCGHNARHLFDEEYARPLAMNSWRRVLEEQGLDIAAAPETRMRHELQGPL